MVEASKSVTIKVESQSQTPSLRLRHRYAALHALFMHYMYIDDLLPREPSASALATGDVVKSFILINAKLDAYKTCGVLRRHCSHNFVSCPDPKS